ncbi:MAG: nicotinic acid mononucleotide adenyltransferase [Flavobacteriaceae bacterium]
MKNAVLLMMISLIFSSAQAQSKKEVKLNADTNLYEATYFHENGAVSQKGNFDLAGKLHGEWVSYDETGAPLSKGSYKKGIRTGKWYFYSENGVKEVEFKNNIVASVNGEDTATRVADNH